MNSLKHGLKLIRFPNLVMMILTLYAVRYLILQPAFHLVHLELALSNFYFALLVMATVSIAAAGYLINDIFDVESDSLNHKPNLIGEIISSRSATLIYYAFNLMGIGCGVTVCLKISQISLTVLFIITAFVLYYYALNYKKIFLLKNIIIAVLCAFLTLMPVLFEFFALIAQPFNFVSGNFALNSVMPIIWLLCAFACFYTLLRELSKDLEDMPGDAQTNTVTIPLKTGIKSAKTISYFLILILFTLTLSGFFLLIPQQDWKSIAFLIVLWDIPLFYITGLLIKAKEKPQFHYLGLIIKVAMFLGIMGCFWI